MYEVTIKFRSDNPKEVALIYKRVVETLGPEIGKTSCEVKPLRKRVKRS